MRRSSPASRRILGAVALWATSLVGCLGSPPEDLSADSSIEATKEHPDASVPEEAAIEPDTGSVDAGADDVVVSDGETEAMVEAGPACLDGGACTPGECLLGAFACSAAGVQACASPSNLFNGTPCDAGADAAAVCNGGTCGACNAGLDCTEAGSCQQLNVVCSSGTAVCTQNGSVADGKSCGTNLFCNQGNCAACTAGAGCTPTGKPCGKGTVTCSGGQVICNDAMMSVADGTSCGQNMVCSGGTCTPCAANVVCSPGPCRAGLTSCATGTSKCVDTGPGQDGVLCTGTNPCNLTYKCLAGTCTGSNPVTCTASDSCHTAGTCNTATGTCSNPVATGASCNDGNACTQTDTCNSSGTCVGSNPVTCTASDSCHTVGTCNTSTGVCSNPNAPNTTVCGTNMTCNGAGSCVCNSGLNSCNGGCANFMTDRLNCGSCGHSCLGGKCDGAGHCLQWNIASVASLSTGIPLASDGTYVAWGEAGSDSTNTGVFTVPIAGSDNGLTPTQLSVTFPYGISIVSGKIYWVTNGSSSDSTLSFATEGSATVTNGSSNNTGGGAFGLGVNPAATVAYIPDSNIDACSPLTASDSCTSIGSIGLGSGHVAYNFTSPTVGTLFVGSGSTLGAMTLPGGTVTNGAGTNILAVTTDSTNVYWLNTASPSSPVLSITRAPLATVTSPASVISGITAGTNFTALGCLAADGTNVYLATVVAGSSSGSSYISFVPKGGGTLATTHIADTPNTIFNMIYVGGALYWEELAVNVDNPNTAINAIRYP